MYGIVPENLCTAIASAIYYTNDDDPSAAELKRLRTDKGVDYVLENICKLDPEGNLAEKIKEKICKLKDLGYIQDEKEG